MRAEMLGGTLLGLSLLALDARGADPTRGPEVRIARAAGPIAIDGDLSDPGWKGAERVETWFEVNPADNTPSRVRNVALLAYDERYLYAGFEFEDPEPSRIRAPFGDRDNLAGHLDYGGLILDTKGDGKTAILFLASPRGIQYDAVTDDSTGNEDSSPDFYWDAVGKITKTGWQLEIRIPFSSLRYPKRDVPTWNILLFRNYPRDFRTQLFSVKLPRGENCFVCHGSPLVGLVGLPSGGALVAAPYVSASEEGVPREGSGGMVNKPVRVTGGLDVKWTPNAVTALDATWHPDFSQVESDVAQVSANERFALFYPEKRPFFLEGIELFSTPIQAVYTRTITSPSWGTRVTGKTGTTSYTALVVEDRGGGSVILPGPNGSGLANQDFSSFVALGRLRHDVGTSFASLLVTDREIRGGGGNRVLGPDFQWRPTSNDTLTGQILYGWSRTPDRPDLASAWDGRSLSGHGIDTWYSHVTKAWDVTAEYKDFSEGFRADAGYVPQAGFREGYAEAGATFYPKDAPVTRLRAFLIADSQADREGALLFRQISPGFGTDGLWSSSTKIRVAFDKVRAQETTISRTQLVYQMNFSPSRVLSLVAISGFLGEQVDFEGARPGHGGKVVATASVRPTDHLELRFDGDLRWLRVRPFDGGEERHLFTAQVERLKATYTFSSRSFLRLIGQYQQLRRSPGMYRDPVEERSGELAASLLFAYKLDWQTLLFAGYGDNRTLTEDGRLEKADRQLFLKVSYSFQR